MRAQDDGTVLVFCRVLTTGTPCFVRRFTAAGAPVGDPLSIDPGCDYAAATGDGRFALGAEVNYEDVWVRFYNASGSAVADRFYYCADAALQERRFGTLSYDDDGTLWITWRAYQFIDWLGYYAPVNLLTTLKPFTPGDMNADDVVNNQDVDGFVLGLFDPAAYEQQYPGIPYNIYGDFTGDGVLNNQDIDGFVAALFGP